MTRYEKAQQAREQVKQSALTLPAATVRRETDTVSKDTVLEGGKNTGVGYVGVADGTEGKVAIEETAAVKKGPAIDNMPSADVMSATVPPAVADTTLTSELAIAHDSAGALARLKGAWYSLYQLARTVEVPGKPAGYLAGAILFLHDLDPAGARLMDNGNGGYRIVPASMVMDGANGWRAQAECVGEHKQQIGELLRRLMTAQKGVQPF